MNDFPNWNSGTTAGEKLLNGKMMDRPSYGNVKATAKYCKTCQKVVWFEHENQAAARAFEIAPPACPDCNTSFRGKEFLHRNWIHEPMFR